MLYSHSSTISRAYEMDIATLQKESAESTRKSKEQMLANLKAKVQSSALRSFPSLTHIVQEVWLKLTEQDKSVRAGFDVGIFA